MPGPESWQRELAGGLAHGLSDRKAQKVAVRNNGYDQDVPWRGVLKGVGQPVRQPQSPQLQCYPLRRPTVLIGSQAPIAISDLADAAGSGWIGFFRLHRFYR